jgi:hypothetical protein
MASLSPSDRVDFAERLSRNPLVAASTAKAAAVIAQQPPVQSVVTMYSYMYKPLGEINDYVSCTVDFARNAVGTATIVMKADDPLAASAMDCYQTTVPITIQVGALRWSGRVDHYDYAMVKGVRTVTLQCVSDYVWFERILCWPNFTLPIQTQYPTKALYIGPAITCIKTLIQEQCFRLQTGLWEAVNNILSLNIDWQSWTATMKESDGNVKDLLMTPIVVVPTDWSTDTSPWVSFNGRMDKISTLVESTVKNNGLVLTADVWLPGDPQPAGLRTPLTLPTIVVDVKDKSNVTGPTATFIDGFIKDAVDIAHAAVGESLQPFLQPNQYAPEGVNIAPRLGVNFTKSWVLFVDHPRSGLIDFHLYGHHPVAFQVVGGGKSPQWVNDLINASFEWMIDSISIAIGITGIPSDLLDGTFDDALLAFQLVENSGRRFKLGPYGLPEWFVQTGSSAYTLDEWFALQGAMWDTRGYHAVTLTFQNGFPYELGKDLFIGDLASFATGGKLYTEYVEKATFKDDRKNRASVTCVIGDGKSHLNPILKTQKLLAKLQEAFQIITLSGN